MAGAESLARKIVSAAPAGAAASAPTVEARIAALQALRRQKRRLPERWQSYLVRCGAIVLAVAVWHLLASTKFAFVIRFDNIPTPDVVGLQFLDLLTTREFYTHVGVSLQRIGISYAFAATLGVLTGILMGRIRIVEDLIVPYIEILRPIPAVAWIPLAILMWPTEESSIIFITFLGAYFPIVINTVHGVESTPNVLVRAARSLGASRTAIFREVVLPGALPSITAGLAIGMGVSWFSLLAGEIISGQYGIGYFTWAAYTLVQYPNIIIGMLTIGLLGTGSTWLVRQLTRPFLRWHTAERR
jgi:NitT/TauT family transport system permease protein